MITITGFQHLPLGATKRKDLPTSKWGNLNIRSAACHGERRQGTALREPNYPTKPLAHERTRVTDADSPGLSAISDGTPGLVLKSFLIVSARYGEHYVQASHCSGFLCFVITYSFRSGQL